MFRHTRVSPPAPPAAAFAVSAAPARYGCRRRGRGGRRPRGALRPRGSRRTPRAPRPRDRRRRATRALAGPSRALGSSAHEPSRELSVAAPLELRAHDRVDAERPPSGTRYGSSEAEARTTAWPSSRWRRRRAVVSSRKSRTPPPCECRSEASTSAASGPRSALQASSLRRSRSRWRKRRGERERVAENVESRAGGRRRGAGTA